MDLMMRSITSSVTTCATLMLASGVAPKVAAERLGHAYATLFTNLYSHVTPTMQREAAAKIGQALFARERRSRDRPSNNVWNPEPVGSRT